MSKLLPDILDLLGRQSHAIDGGEPQKWADTFTVDGEFHSPTYPAPVRGRDALSAFAATFANENPRTRHIVTNVCIDREISPAEVRVRANLLIVRTETQDDHDAVRIDRVTTINDHVVLVDGHWRIAERSVTRD